MTDANYVSLMTEEERKVLRDGLPKFDLEESRRSFSPLEENVYRLVRSMLWVLYPTPDNLDCGEEADAASDANAVMVVSGLKEFCPALFVDKARNA